MRLRYHEIRGKRVRSADGCNLGHVQELLAERQGDSLRVHALLVGPTSMVRRIGFKRGLMVQSRPPRQIPWRMVARIEGEIHLSVDLRDLPERGSEADPSNEPRKRAERTA